MKTWYTINEYNRLPKHMIMNQALYIIKIKAMDNQDKLTGNCREVVYETSNLRKLIEIQIV